MRDLPSYSGALTREQFLFREMRVVACLRVDEYLDDAELLDRVVQDNLLQYPTDRMTRNIAGVCLKRLDAMDDAVLTELLAHGPAAQAKQVNLYAMACTYRLVWEFLTQLVAERFKTLNLHLSRADVAVFIANIQEQDDDAAAWTDSTCNKLNQVLRKCLAEAGFLAESKSTDLEPVVLDMELEDGIRRHGDEELLGAFNCISSWGL